LAQATDAAVVTQMRTLKIQLFARQLLRIAVEPEDNQPLPGNQPVFLRGC
jgi:hypothetical protein